MRKRIIVLITTLALVGILAASSTAMASKPPPNPVEQWEVLVAKVSDIWDILTGAGGLAEINQALSDIQDTLDGLKSPADLTAMESGSGFLPLEGPCVMTGHWTGTVQFGPYDEVRHVSVTAKVSSGDTSWTAEVRVLAGFETSSGTTSWRVVGWSMDPGTAMISIEFDAKQWAMQAWTSGGVGDGELQYNYTVTYPSPVG